MNYLVGMFLACLAIYTGFPWWAAVFFAIAWGYVKK